jgi:hypothetical protein
MQDDWEFCSRDLAALVQFCDLLGPALASFLPTAPSVIRSRMLFGRFDLPCHFHEGRDAQGGAPSLILLRKAFVVRHFYFGRRRPEW